MLILALVMLLPPLAQQGGEVDLVLQDGTRIIVHNGPVMREGDILRANGDLVVVTYQDVRVEAQWAEYNDSTKQLTAGDHVRFIRGEEELEGGRLRFNRDSKTGTLTDVKGQVEPGFLVTAREAERLADGRWVLQNPMFTSCTEECPPWTFTLAKAVVEPGNKVTGRNTVFRFHGLPIFYLPYAVIPTVGRERSTGFLMPTMSTSNAKGRSIRESFYWAVNRSADVTFTGEYFSKRGPAGTIGFRAAPNADTRVDLATFFAIDREKQGGQSTRILAYSSFGDGWRGVADVNIWSSFTVRQVYEEGFNLISSPIEHSVGFVTNNREHSSINFLYNRSAIFFPDQPSVALRKFPAVDFSLPTESITRKIPVYFSFDSGFAGVARRDGQIDAPSLMQRVDVRPAIDIPLLRSSAVRWSHHLSVRDTLYTHSLRPVLARNTLNRAAVEYTMHLSGPQLERNFGTWRHIVEPSLEYRKVTGINRFRETIVVDDADLMADTNEIEFAVTNRLMAGHEFLSWRVAQKLYLDPEFGGALVAGRRNVFEPLMDLTGFAFSDGTRRRFSPLVSTIRIATSPQTSTDIQVDYDTQREEFRSAGIMGELNHGSLYSSLAYFFNKRDTVQLPNNQLRGLVRYGRGDKPGVVAGFSFYYDLARSLLQGATAQVSYNTGCYGLNFEFTKYDFGVRKESRFQFSLSLKNLGSFGTLSRQERLF